MKFIKNNKVLVLLSLTIVVLLYFALQPSGIDDLENKINIIEIEKDDLKKSIAEKEKEIKKTRLYTNKISGDYKELLLRSKIKPPETVKTIYVDRVKYVEKIIYRELYDFSLTLRSRFDEYIEKTLSERKITDILITDLKLVNKKSESQTQLVKDIANGWTLSYGGYVGFGINGASAGVGITYSKRLRKIK